MTNQTIIIMASGIVAAIITGFIFSRRIHINTTIIKKTIFKNNYLRINMNNLKTRCDDTFVYTNITLNVKRNWSIKDTYKLAISKLEITHDSAQGNPQTLTFMPDNSYLKFHLVNDYGVFLDIYGFRLPVKSLTSVQPERLTGTLVIDIYDKNHNHTQEIVPFSFELS